MTVKYFFKCAHIILQNASLISPSLGNYVLSMPCMQTNSSGCQPLPPPPCWGNKAAGAQQQTAHSPLLKCLCCPTLAICTSLDTVVYCRVSEISLQFSCSSAPYGQLRHQACRSCQAGCKPFLTDPDHVWLEMNTKTICKMSFVKVLSQHAQTHRQGRL